MGFVDGHAQGLRWDAIKATDRGGKFHIIDWEFPL
jgi:hypothetical protein